LLCISVGICCLKRSFMGLLVSSIIPSQMEQYSSRSGIVGAI
jgi:hypothetical protein